MVLRTIVRANDLRHNRAMAEIPRLCLTLRCSHAVAAMVDDEGIAARGPFARRVNWLMTLLSALRYRGDRDEGCGQFTRDVCAIGISRSATEILNKAGSNLAVAVLFINRS